MLCDHLERWDREGGREGDARGKRYGNICICITDSLCYKAETNKKKKKAGVAILISQKTDFKIKTITREKEGHYIMIKGSIQEEDITIVNIYAPNIGAPQYIRQMLTAIQGEMNSNTIRVGFVNTPLTSIHRSSTWKINMETQAINDTL